MGMYTTPDDVADEILETIQEYNANRQEQASTLKHLISGIVKREMSEEYKLGGEHMSMMAEDGIGIAFSFEAVIRYQSEYQEYLNDKPSIAREPIPFEKWFLDKIQEFKGRTNNLIL